MKFTTTVKDCAILPLDHKAAEGCNISFIGNSDTLPFAIKRIFYIYQINRGCNHSGHAHYREEQAIVAASGSFEVKVTDGKTEAVFSLDNPDEALYVPAGIWHSLHSFSEDAVCLTFSSTKFDENDYIRDYAAYADLRR